MLWITPRDYNSFILILWIGKSSQTYPQWGYHQRACSVALEGTINHKIDQESQK